MYLLYYLRRHEAYLAEKGRGSTFEAITRDDLEELRIPIPDGSPRIRVVKLLDENRRLVLAAQYSAGLSESLLESTFRSWFGDDQSMPTPTVEELAADGPNNIRTGPFGSQLLHSEFTTEGVAVLGIDNAVNNRFGVS